MTDIRIKIADEANLYNPFSPEDSLDAAIQFGRENGQRSVFILSSGTDVPLN